jgi:hypothetical protein
VPKQFEKTVAEVLDYKFDFKPLGNSREGAESNYLESGETLASYTLTPETGITVDSDALADTNTTVLVWLSGGTLNDTYTIECKAVTSDGRTVERAITVKIVKARAR